MPGAGAVRDEAGRTGEELRGVRSRRRLGLAGLDRGGRCVLGGAVGPVPARRKPVEVLLRRKVAEQRLETLSVDRLLGDELLRQRLEAVAMDLEDLACPLERSIDDRS